MISTINTIIFCGGRGAKNLISALIELNNQRAYNFDIKVVVNAYDDGLSTGIIRKYFNCLGPSDVRKNIEHLLDKSDPKFSAISDFFNIRTGEEYGLNNSNFIQNLKSIINQNSRYNSHVLNIYKQLPLEFQNIIREGIESYLNTIESEKIVIDYSDFNLMNIVFAGLLVQDKDLQKAADSISATLPLCGKVLINSIDNLYLYGLREYRDDSSVNLLLDEAEIVSQRSFARIKNIYLLKDSLDESERAEYEKSDTIELILKKKSVYPVISDELKTAIQNSQLILYAPGTQHSSLYPTYLTENLADIIARNKNALKLFMCNVGEDADITNYSAFEIIDKAYRYLTSNSIQKIEFQDLFSTILIRTGLINIAKG